MGCQGTTASFIIRKSRTSLHLTFDFCIPKIRMLHGLLQGINSPCSFKVLMMCFNPQPQVSMDTASYVEISGSLSLTTIGIAFCVRPTDFPSSHTLGFTFYSTKGRERDGSIFMKTEAWTLFCIFLPKRGEGDSGTIRNSCENSPESQLRHKE